jgi:uncharacterized SAM-binding protein YcdF (DUF218 family)
MSTNTAENFYNTKQLIESNLIACDQIYVVTSSFHYNRASLIMNKIYNNIDIDANIGIDVSWILADKELPDSRYWESIHIKNVVNDIRKLKKKLLYK